jgi:3-hydroxyisobutyrate dehydrogenase-like beta-hydroxyacid dehydrogenase
MPVGFIGVGNIGSPMAAQLLKAGYALVVRDIRREALAPLLAAGATWADSPRGVAVQCEVVATCLPGPVEMEQVTLGPEGILAVIKAGALYIDHTTNGPMLARKDLGLVTDLGRTYNIPMRMATLYEQEMNEGISRGWGKHNSSIVLTLQEERAQTQVRLPSAEPDRA